MKKVTCLENAPSLLPGEVVEEEEEEEALRRVIM
jgi:hypothetical protein